MNSPRITLLKSQEAALLNHLGSHPEGHERAAVVLFRRLACSVTGLDASDRYLAVKVAPFEDHWVTSSSKTHIKFELKYLRELFRECEDRSLVFGFVHNHPTNAPGFSDLDDTNETTLLKALCNRNGKDRHFVAMLWADGSWTARIRHGTAPKTSQSVRHTLVLDRPFEIYGYSSHSSAEDGATARSAAAFGRPFVEKLESLRVGVVGLGGTGSATTMQLARAGIGELVIVDGDRLDETNINRVHGAGMRDVGRKKTEVMQDAVNALNLATKVSAFETSIDQSPIAIDALSTCDVVFGCTDDQIGREVLNTAVYVYLLPLIDVGLGGQVVDDDNGQPYLRYHFGRVSTILPESGECLFCQGVIRDTWIQYEYALRQNPRMAETEARERYLEGGGEEAPGVGPFTSVIADYGVATLFDLIKPFRNFPPELRFDLFKIDFVKMEIRSHQARRDVTCPYCGHRDYLLLDQETRLNRPILGKPNVAL